MIEIDVSKIDSTIERAISEGAFPGATLCVLSKGDLVHHQAYGRVSWQADEAVTVDTVYDLASVSKVFTATSVLKLLGEGSIRLDMATEELVPELRNTHHGLLTVRQLLEHTSGQPRRFTRIIEAEAAFTLAAGPTAQVTADERTTRISKLLEDLRDVDLLFEPGTRVAYTSLGYFVLGVMIERLTGNRLDEHVYNAVTRPLGLNTINYLPPGTSFDGAVIAPTEACPWRRIKVQGQVHDEITAYMGGISGHAGLFGTASDIAAFGLAILESELLDINRQLLKRSVQSQTKGLPGEERGWGWLINSAQSFMGDFVSPESFGHTGFTGTSLLIDPKLQLVVALLTNRVNESRRNNRIDPVRRQIHDEIALSVAPWTP